MTSALALVLMLAVPTRCLIPEDQSAGWKQVMLPDGWSSLAAPEGVDQFRPDEPARVFEIDPRAYLGCDRRRLGRKTLEFSVPREARMLEVELGAPLRGAKIDAVGLARGRSYPLLLGRRIAGSALRVDWELPEIDGVLITVHDHFRGTPVVRSWRMERLSRLAEDPTLAGAFKDGRSLYFRHPGGRRIELCEAPGRTLEVHRRSLDPPARPVWVSAAIPAAPR